MRRPSSLPLIVAAVLAACSFVAVMLIVTHGTKSATQQSAATATASAATQVTAPQHAQISDAAGPVSVPPKPQVCPSTAEVNEIVHNMNEASYTQDVNGSIVCKDGWAFARVTGYLHDDKVTRGTPTYILLFYNGSKWTVVTFGEPVKLAAGNEICQRQLPREIRTNVCA